MTSATDLHRQRTAALAQGNRIRIAKANARKEIKQMSRQDGLRAVAALITECPPHVQKMRLGDLLVWVQYVTRAKLPHYIPDSQHASFSVRPDQILRDIPSQRRELIAERIERMAASK